MLSIDRGDRIRLTPALVADLSKVAGLSDATTWRDLGGTRTTNLLARSAGKGDAVVIRLHRPETTFDRLRAEQFVRKTLQQAGVPSVAALDLPSGDSIGTLPTGQLVEVEPFVESDGRMNTLDRLMQGYQVLGRVHDVLRATQLPNAAREVSHANYLPRGVVAEAARAGADRVVSWNDPVLSDVASRAVGHLDNALSAEHSFGETPHQVVHGDFWDDNVLFQDDNLVAVLDFEFMAARSRVDDLALPIWFLLLEPGRGLPSTKDRDDVAAMLGAYDRGTQEPLTADERRILPVVVARQVGWVLGRWIRDLDLASAQQLARGALRGELPVAVAILSDLDAWQRALK